MLTRGCSRRPTARKSNSTPLLNPPDKRTHIVWRHPEEAMSPTQHNRHKAFRVLEVAAQLLSSEQNATLPTIRNAVYRMSHKTFRVLEEVLYFSPESSTNKVPKPIGPYTFTPTRRSRATEWGDAGHGSPQSTPVCVCAQTRVCVCVWVCVCVCACVFRL